MLPKKLVRKSDWMRVDLPRPDSPGEQRERKRERERQREIQIHLNVKDVPPLSYVHLSDHINIIIGHIATKFSFKYSTYNYLHTLKAY